MSAVPAEDKRDFSFRAYAWRQFKKNKPALYSLYFLFFLIVIALLAPILANDQPLYVQYKENTLFPAISFAKSAEITDEAGSTQILRYDIVDWKKLDLDAVIWPPIAYSPGKTDLLNSGYVGPNDQQLFRDENGQIVDLPKRFWHWLGTSKRGEDVLAGLIHGTRISLTIGILAMSIASVLGIFFGSMAGYFGDNRLIVSRGAFWFTILGLILAFYYAFISRSHILAEALSTSGAAISFQIVISLVILVAVTYLFSFAGRAMTIIPFLASRVNIPVDSIISRIIEILISIPNLILIISIAAIAKPSLVNLMIIIGFTNWTGIARFTRAEFLKIRSLEYVQAAQALGYSELRIILKHALPNGLAPAFIAIAFGIASAILIESGLSFLGIGVPHDVVTWGSLLNAGKENFNAWWLVIFPGLAIFLTVTIYNLLGEGLRDALDPRLKQ
jgi:peptide/nickel transport system permease protein